MAPLEAPGPMPVPIVHFWPSETSIRRPGTRPPGYRNPELPPPGQRYRGVAGLVEEWREVAKQLRAARVDTCRVWDEAADQLAERIAREGHP